MKRNSIRNRISGLATTLLLALAAPACVDTTIYDVGKDDAGDVREVTFEIETEILPGGTRAVQDDGPEAPVTYPHEISNGRNADLLIFAVYEKQGGSYKLDESFGKGNEVEFDDGTKLKAPDDQTYVKVTELPLKIKLAVAPGKVYKVAFWLQNHKAVDYYYDTKDLTKVEVIYETKTKTAGNDGEEVVETVTYHPNNDELRDAFCQLSGEVKATGANQRVILRRPLAQVNVGTAGWDYEGAAILRPSAVSYTTSKITIEGVARFFNVLEDRALNADELNDDDGDATTDVTFDYNTIPAFIHLNEEDLKKLDYKPVPGKEEFLYVKLTKDEGYLPYISWEEKYGKKDDSKPEDEGEPAGGGAAGKPSEQGAPGAEGTPEESKKPETETFKYLSMCYILAPEATTEKPGESSSSPVTVKFWTKGVEIKDKKEEEAQPSADDPQEQEDVVQVQKEFTLLNVPIRKNWRTNILGENFFIYREKFFVDIVHDYSGDYNYPTDEPTTGGQEWPQEGGKEYHTLEFPNKDWAYKETNYTPESDSDEDDEPEVINGSLTETTENPDPTNYDPDKYRDSWYRSFNSSYFDIVGYKGNSNVSCNVKYENKTYSYAKKIDSKAWISFETSHTTTVSIVVVSPSDPTKGTDIMFDGKSYVTDLPAASQPAGSSSNCWVYTIKNVPAGRHKIKRNDHEVHVAYVKVQDQSRPKDDTVDEDDEFEYQTDDDVFNPKNDAQEED